MAKETWGSLAPSIRSIKWPARSDECQDPRLNWLHLLFQSIAVGHRFEFHANGVGDGDDGSSLPCGVISLSVRLRAAFGSSTCEEDITFAAFNSP